MRIAVGADGGPAPAAASVGHASHRIRLLKFVTLFAIGGTEGQVVALTKGIDRSRFDVHLACLQRRGELLGQLGTAAAPVTEYRINNLFNRRALGERLRFARDLRRHRIEVLHTYSFYPNMFAIPAARLAGTPLVVASIRDMGAYLTRLQRRVQRLVCRLADRVLVNADAVRDWLIADGYPADRISVIRNGLDLTRFPPRGSGAAFRREFALPPTTPLVAAVSRVSPIKGLEYFVDAAAMVATKRDDARFLIIGAAADHERDYRRALEARVARLGLVGRVLFTGLRLDVPQVLSEAAVSVLPSLTEGLSNVVLESMAAQVPVIATRVGGTAEAVEDGITGLLAPPRDAQALAAAICRILDDRDTAARLARAGRQRVVEQFSMPVAIQQTEQLYQELLEMRQHARRR